VAWRLELKEISMTRIRVENLAFVLLLASCTTTGTGSVEAEDWQALPSYLQDRGTGVTTSIFGTYVRENELLVYPFWEYDKKSADEYHGSELGYVGDQDFLGKSKAEEVGLFLGYGLTEDLAIEVEGILHEKATFERAPEDTSSGLPPELEESGLGAVEAQLRWRFARETPTSPEWFTNLEVAFPLQKDKVLIGEQGWGFSVGLGMVRGFEWGTLTPRISVGYEREEDEFVLGEYAIEYLKRLDDRWRVVSTLEGEDDEVSIIGEVQYRIGAHAVIKVGSGFGITEQASDYAPEVGLLLSF
jgi:hypothetical protein